MIQKHPDENVSVGPKDSSNVSGEWQGTIFGPVGTPYENGIFKVSIRFPYDYPWKPPSVYFLTKTYHPNISLSSGYCCCSILKEDFSPALSISKIMLSICSLLSSPNPDDPVEKDIAELYQNNRLLFDTKARFYTSKYA